MIFGIGTDIVSVSRMRAALERHGERFAERILAPCERDAYQASPCRERFLAKRFAAKEAAAKALGTGFSGGLSLHHIVVTHNAAGRPLLRFDGRGSELLRNLGVGASHLSISDEHEYAVAFVTLMQE